MKLILMAEDLRCCLGKLSDHPYQLAVVYWV